MKLSRLLLKNEEKQIISITGGGGKTSTLFTLARELANFRVLLTTTTKILLPESSGLYDIVIEKNNERLLQLICSKPHKNHIVCGITSEKYPEKLTGCSESFLNEVKEFYDYILIEADGSAGKPIKAPAEHEPAVSQYSTMYIGVIGMDCLEKNGSSENVHRPELFSKIRNKRESELISVDDIIRLVNSPVGLFKGSSESGRKILLLNKGELLSESIGISMVDRIVEEADFPIEVVLNSYLKSDSVLYNRENKPLDFTSA
ncbi:MAG: putative selenium-dependent hydroxylase accessory protein YqeC [Spirochaetaceae bacterium]|nr:putative selenium-dependent hydroxylase accessory protein YqeC [Spirochaetaceae bacterium]